jgi:HAMP domain-containing protein
MDDELLSTLGRVRRDELAEPSAEADPVHTAEAPLTNTERTRVLDAVFAKLDAGEPDATTSGAKVIAPSRWRSGALVGAVLAIAAALALVIARPSAQQHDELAALPSFTITRLEGGASVMRSDPGSGPLQLRSASDAIDIVITPGARVHEPLAVVVVARGEDGAPRLVAITELVERSSDGAVRIRGPLDRFVVLAPGTWTLDWVVSRVGAEPRSIEAFDDAKVAHAWRVVTTKAIIAS